MIVIKVELWPGGDEQSKQLLAQGVVWNRVDHDQHPKRGNYGAIFQGKTERYHRTSTVEDYPRQSRHVWELIRRALNNTEQPL